jgi:uncharacterized membrane protein
MNAATFLTIATIVAMLGTGLIGGVFFAFSNFVMRGLGRLPPNEGIAAMQHINVTVLNPLFLGVFVGTVGLCVAIAITALLQTQPLSRGTPYLVAAALLYVLGTFVATLAFNVPKNDTLAALPAHVPASAGYWREYLQRWTFWNHVRTVCSLGALVMFSIALSHRS